MKVIVCVLASWMLASSMLLSGEQIDFTQAAADAHQEQAVTRPATAPAFVSSGAVDEYYRAYYQAKAKHDVAQFEQDTAIYTWQRHTSTAATMLVFVIVGIGLALSVQQFRQGSALETSLELSREGLKIKSPVIGLIVLTVSLVFFYLFLKVVYPITAPP